MSNSITLPNEWFRVPHDQCKRYASAFLDPLYLLKTEKTEQTDQNPTESHNYSIVGTTKNVYTITINLSNKKIWCNCPDQKSHCQKKNISCKHIAFVISKIGKINDINIYKTGCREPLPNEYIDTIWTNATKTSVDKKLIEKFNSLTITTTSDTNTPPSPSPPPTIDELLNGETDCPICFSDLKNNEGNLSNCISCKQCKKYVHTICFDRWASFNSQKCCVYCRFSFNNIPKKSQNQQQYINLL